MCVNCQINVQKGPRFGYVAALCCTCELAITQHRANGVQAEYHCSSVAHNAVQVWDKPDLWPMVFPCTRAISLRPRMPTKGMAARWKRNRSTPGCIRIEVHGAAYKLATATRAAIDLALAAARAAS